MHWNEFRTRFRHLSAKDLKRVERAFELGSTAHEGQLRRSGEPYFSHPIAVAHMLADMGGDSDTIIAALLHDTVEDTDLTLQKIAKEFSGDVPQLIDGVTKIEPKDVANSPTLDEQIETLRKIFTLVEQDVRIMVIKLADRLHNVQTAEFLPDDRKIALARETQEVFVKIADRLCMQDMRDELESLSLSILEPDLHKELLSLREKNEREGLPHIQWIQKELHKTNPQEMEDTKVLYELKSWTRLKAQLDAKGAPVTGVSSLTAVFVCPSVSDCYKTLGMLHQHWQRETLSFEDFINSPMINGYKGLHTTVILQNGTRVRCKIRTNEMQEYAHKGITTMCFGNKARGLLHYLPWAQRISSVTQDTQRRSSEFWESLQSDILGQSIIIHGPGGEALPVPQGSTALDGAFYLIQEKALSVSAIKINGKEVPFHTLLGNAVSLEMDLDKQKTVKRSWLDWVQTGFATAQIRRALGNEPRTAKIDIGKKLLQKVFDAKKKGLLEEFDKSSMHTALSSIGYQSSDQAYIAIADGHLDPNEAFAALFRTVAKKSGVAKTLSILRYSFRLADSELVARILALYIQNKDAFQGIGFRFNPFSGIASVSAKIMVPEGTEDALASEFRLSGASNVEIQPAKSKIAFFAILFTLIVLWGLDPVFAKMLLNEGVSPLGFSFIRNASVLACASMLFLSVRHRRKFSPIPLFRPYFWIAAGSFFLVSVLTYLSLDISSPAVYNTVIRGNAVLQATPMLLLAAAMTQMGVAWFFTLIGLLILGQVTAPGELPLLLATLAIFAIYTKASAKFQMEARIEARYPHVFFYLSTFSMAFSLLLPFLPSFSFPSPPLTVFAILFSILFVGVPYMIFYHLTFHYAYETISRYINASLAITLLAQWLLIGNAVNTYIILAGCCFVIGNLLSSKLTNASQEDVIKEAQAALGS